MATLVMKFGGSLTADATRMARVAQIILSEAQAWDRLVVVISAVVGATDTLGQALAFAAARNAAGFRRAVTTLRESHLSLIDDLFAEQAIRRHLTEQIDRRLFDVLAICDRVMTTREATPRERDSVMAAGEQILVPIVSAYLRHEGLRTALIEADSVIVTDDTHQNANPLPDLIEERVERLLRPVLDQGMVAVMAGFIGATRAGVLTTMGRGGSDYTATLIGAALRADEVWMWTNVDGIMSTDPEWVPNARVIPVLSYEEVGELSYFGARVLHPDAIEPLAQRSIPLRVRNPDNLDHAGTLIQAEAPVYEAALKAVTAVDGLCLTVQGQPIDLSEFLGQIRHLVGSAATGPVIVMQSHHRAVLIFVVLTSEGPQAVARAAERLAAELPRWEVQPVKVIAAIGAPAMLRAEIDAQPLASAIGPGNRRLMAVRPGDARAVVRQLHRLTEINEPPEMQLWPQTPGRPPEH